MPISKGGVSKTKGKAREGGDRQKRSQQMGALSSNRHLSKGGDAVRTGEEEFKKPAESFRKNFYLLRERGVS